MTASSVWSLIVAATPGSSGASVAETAGEHWLQPHLFRYGASSLLNDVLLQRQKLRTGRYSGPDYVTVD